MLTTLPSLSPAPLLKKIITLFGLVFGSSVTMIFFKNRKCGSWDWGDGLDNEVLAA